MQKIVTKVDPFSKKVVIPYPISFPNRVFGIDYKGYFGFQLFTTSYDNNKIELNLTHFQASYVELLVVGY